MRQISSSSSDATEKVAERLGRRLRGGEVIELLSDLGGGKTTFVRGLARGAGSTSHVASPTFKISSEYKTPKFNIFHFDFYRLTEAGIVANEIKEVVDDPHGVVVVEWGEIVKNALPPKRLKVKIKNVDENERQLMFTCPNNLEYLLEDLK
ncbi:MAG TPA: tRNA (adenosine(37)-N6)-threonylcarbamoyltransferase complex ATPase subunit type 1 TsaE [Patescibacteria group bacterium]|nr:tRNA (adenosine(37)-N6)-threonylcarbamoyltransferase complex ATPase subunit type 1 TsaE [Patescibacteria group bacterium]